MSTAIQRIFYSESRPTIVCLRGSNRFFDEFQQANYDLTDDVYVLDVDGYVGGSTKSEIVYASQHGIPIRYQSQERS